MVALLAAWLLLGAPQRLPATPRNAGFEQSTPAGVPEDWLLSNFGGQPFRVDSVPGRAGTGARVHLAAPGGAGAGYAVLFQNLDPTALRGKLVRIRAQLKVQGSTGLAGLTLRVFRPQPKSVGFHYDMDDQPVPAGEWKQYTFVGRVADDAVQILIGVVTRGDADVIVDDLSVEPISADPTPPAAAAKAYLLQAIELLRANHIDSAKADWPRITSDALAEIGGAKTTADTYNAIRGVIGALGEKHTMFLSPAMLAAQKAGAAVAPGDNSSAAPPLPSTKLLDGGIGFAWLPHLYSLADGEEHSRRYAETLRSGLQGLDGQVRCGWIVDLRDDGGGNMWPMLQGLDPLLGAAPFGFFADAQGKMQVWARTSSGVIPVPGTTAETRDPAFALVHAGAPVAVLIGPRTASSGEMTAMALIGRDGARTFGQPSGGYTTGNRALPLSDGARLILTGVYVRDRTGKQYDGPIVPDAATTTPEEEAIRWLSSQCR